MADEADDILRQYGNAPAYTTADVVDRMPRPSNPMDFAAYMRDRAMRGEKFSPEMTAKMEAPPHTEPNWFGKALGAIPPEVSFMANFLGPNVKLPRVPAPIEAYHASPHKFNRFDSSKLLTGEGNNAFLPGMYFAENAAVSGKGGQYDKQFRMEPRYLELADGEVVPLSAARLAEGMPADERARVLGKGFTGHDFLNPAERVGERIKALERGERPTAFQQEAGWGDIDILRKTYDILEGWRQRGAKPQRPSIYDVAIHAKPTELLDLDAPIKGQGEAARDAIRSHYKDWTSRELVSQWTDTPKMSAMEWIRKHPTSANMGFAEALRDNGILGARYLDGDSRRMANEIKTYETRRAQALERGDPANAARHEMELERLRSHPYATKPTSNYVMLPGTEDIIEILNRYGRGGSVRATRQC